MTFSLIDKTGGAIPIAALTKDRLSALAQGVRRSLSATGCGRSAFRPTPASSPWCRGRGAVSPGRWSGSARRGDATQSIWALAGLPEALPEGSYRLEAVPDGADPTQLAWAGRSAVCLHPVQAKSGPPPHGLARGRGSGRVERLASGVRLARDLVNTPAEISGRKNSKRRR